jgi:hypothetical protein
MKKEINKLLCNKYIDTDLNNTRSEVNIHLIAAIKARDYKKICHSILLDLFLEDYVIQDSQGYSVLIWGKDNLLIKWRNHEKILLTKQHKGYNKMFMENYGTTSTFVKLSLNEYSRYPILLRSNIFS